MRTDDSLYALLISAVLFHYYEDNPYAMRGNGGGWRAGPLTPHFVYGDYKRRSLVMYDRENSWIFILFPFYAPLIHVAMSRNASLAYNESCLYFIYLW